MSETISTKELSIRRLASRGAAPVEVALAVVLAAVTAISAAQTEVDPEPPVPVLVELFTSQGCSSCPPADRLLRELVEKQPVPGVEVLALSFHVDYWNRLGWRDPFSSPRWSARQREYARRFGETTVFTPQAVVDGTRSLVGSDRDGMLAAIAAAAERTSERLDVTARTTGAPAGTPALHVRGPSLADAAGTRRLHVAIVEDGLSVSVPRGENAGRELSHVRVVRDLYSETLPAGFEEGAITVQVRTDPTWKPDLLGAVVWVEDARGATVALGRCRLGGARGR